MGIKHRDALEMFEKDGATEAVVMVGEIGGDDEERAAEWARGQYEQAGGGLYCGRDRPARQAAWGMPGRLFPEAAAAPPKKSPA